ncbi:MAG: hypothetical protein ACPG7F_20165, partial [Aggregatilineales bacterium]
MNINPMYLEISYDKAGVRDSQKRLKELISEVAVNPVQDYQDELVNHFDMVEAILTRRIAAVIAYWAQHKHDPIVPKSSNLMSDITNASKNDITLKEFYIQQVRAGMHELAPILGLAIPDDFTPSLDELEYVLLELEEVMDVQPVTTSPAKQSYSNADIYGDYESYADYPAADDNDFDLNSLNMGQNDHDNVENLDVLQTQELDIAMTNTFAALANADVVVEEVDDVEAAEMERAIVSAASDPVIQVNTSQGQMNVLQVSAEQAWQLVYGMMGYQSEYIQQQMLPRWQQYPQQFDKDRQYLYRLFVESIQKSAGASFIGGNFLFAERRITVDGLWNHYFMDLSQNIAPQLTAARLEASVNMPWYQKMFQRVRNEVGKISIIWLVALGIALMFDGLTTFVALDQTPMEGGMVILFSVLITALFQIADQLVINYRQREFDAEALSAKFRARYQSILKSLESLPVTSESYVQLSMEKSKSHSDWKAAEDNRKMSRRGRFWSARIADINVLVT